MTSPQVAPPADDEIRDGFKFRGGSLPLDFAATLAARLKEQPRDLLAEPVDLARWFVAAGLASDRLDVSDAELQNARDLREALYRLAVARANREPFHDDDLTLLNDTAAGATPAPRLEHGGMTWVPAATPSLLAAIARAAVELFGGPLGDRVRRCAGDGCALLFVDTSRSGHRKWCSMAGCGNKAKVASFRDRKRE